jgi:hypothetical protein
MCGKKRTFSMMERTVLKRPAFLRIQSPVIIHVCMQLRHWKYTKKASIGSTMSGSVERGA